MDLNDDNDGFRGGGGIMPMFKTGNSRGISGHDSNSFRSLQTTGPTYSAGSSAGSPYFSSSVLVIAGISCAASFVAAIMALTLCAFCHGGRKSSTQITSNSNRKKKGSSSTTNNSSTKVELAQNGTSTRLSNGHVGAAQLNGGPYGMPSTSSVNQLPPQSPAVGLELVSYTSDTLPRVSPSPPPLAPPPTSVMVVTTSQPIPINSASATSVAGEQSASYRMAIAVGHQRNNSGSTTFRSSIASAANHHNPNHYGPADRSPAMSSNRGDETDGQSRSTIQGHSRQSSAPNASHHHHPQPPQSSSQPQDLLYSSQAAAAAAAGPGPSNQTPQFTSFGKNIAYNKISVREPLAKVLADRAGNTAAEASTASAAGVSGNGAGAKPQDSNNTAGESADGSTATYPNYHTYQEVEEEQLSSFYEEIANSTASSVTYSRIGESSFNPNGPTTSGAGPTAAAAAQLASFQRRSAPEPPTASSSTHPHTHSTVVSDSNRHSNPPSAGATAVATTSNNSLAQLPSSRPHPKSSRIIEHQYADPLYSSVTSPTTIQSHSLHSNQNDQPLARSSGTFSGQQQQPVTITTGAMSSSLVVSSSSSLAAAAATAAAARAADKPPEPPSLESLMIVAECSRSASPNQFHSHASGGPASVSGSQHARTSSTTSSTTQGSDFQEMRKSTNQQHHNHQPHYGPDLYSVVNKPPLPPPQQVQTKRQTVHGIPHSAMIDNGDVPLIDSEVGDLYAQIDKVPGPSRLVVGPGPNNSTSEWDRPPPLPPPIPPGGISSPHNGRSPRSVSLYHEVGPAPHQLHASSSSSINSSQGVSRENGNVISITVRNPPTESQPPSLPHRHHPLTPTNSSSSSNHPHPHSSSHHHYERARPPPHTVTAQNGIEIDDEDESDDYSAGPTYEEPQLVLARVAARQQRLPTATKPQDEYEEGYETIPSQHGVSIHQEDVQDPGYELVNHNDAVGPSTGPQNGFLNGLRGDDLYDPSLHLYSRPQRPARSKSKGARGVSGAAAGAGASGGGGDHSATGTIGSGGRSDPGYETVQLPADYDTDADPAYEMIMNQHGQKYSRANSEDADPAYEVIVSRDPSGSRRRVNGDDDDEDGPPVPPPHHPHTSYSQPHHPQRQAQPQQHQLIRNGSDLSGPDPGYERVLYIPRDGQPGDRNSRAASPPYDNLLYEQLAPPLTVVPLPTSTTAHNSTLVNGQTNGTQVQSNLPNTNTAGPLKATATGSGLAAAGGVVSEPQYAQVTKAPPTAAVPSSTSRPAAATTSQSRIQIQLSERL